MINFVFGGEKTRGGGLFGGRVSARYLNRIRCLFATRHGAPENRTNGKRFVNARRFPMVRRGAFGWSRKAGGRASQFKRVASVARSSTFIVSHWIAHLLPLFRAYNGVTSSAWKSTTANTKNSRLTLKRTTLSIVDREDDGCTSEFEQRRHRQQLATEWRRHAANRLVFIMRAILYVTLFSWASSNAGTRRRSLVEHQFRHLVEYIHCRKITFSSIIFLTWFIIHIFVSITATIVKRFDSFEKETIQEYGLSILC